MTEQPKTEPHILTEEEAQDCALALLLGISLEELRNKLNEQSNEHSSKKTSKVYGEQAH